MDLDADTILSLSQNPLGTGHVSSAIPDLSVATIRKGLGEIRTKWVQSSPDRPLFICDSLNLYKSLTVQQFAAKFVLGQHLKRHAKSNVQRAAKALLESATGAGNNADTGSGIKDSARTMTTETPETPSASASSIPLLTAMAQQQQESSGGVTAAQSGIMAELADAMCTEFDAKDDIVAETSASASASASASPSALTTPCKHGTNKKDAKRGSLKNNAAITGPGLVQSEPGPVPKQRAPKTTKAHAQASVSVDTTSGVLTMRSTTKGDAATHYVLTRVPKQ